MVFDKSKGNNHEDSDFDQISELLGELYKPDEEEISEFPSFWQSLKQKIDTEDNKTELSEDISKHCEEIKKDYDKRQEKIQELKIVVDNTKKTGKKKDFDPNEHRVVWIDSNGENDLSEEDRYWAGLSAFIDGELPESKKIEITNHLIECSECRQNYNKLNKVGKLLKQEYKVPDDSEIKLPEKLFWKELNKKLPEGFVVSKKRVLPKAKIAVALAVFIVISLASIASFKQKNNYNYIGLEDERINWSSLKLDKEQQKQISEIEQDWKSFKKEQERFIKASKDKLSKELARERPNLMLVDKYHRDILDHEILLKREKSNIFLEKRFVLSEEQTLSLLRQINSSN